MEAAIKKIHDWIALNNPNEWLELYDLGLTELPTIPSNCVKFCCHGNKLTNVPPLNYQELCCYDNKLTTLPELPGCTTIDCRQNNLTTLPDLPLCWLLDCTENELRTLPELPLCKYIYCDRNKITYIPNLPLCQELNCTYNQLISLPHMPECKDLDCYCNEYIHITEQQAQKFDGVLESPNYNLCAKVIQRNYKNYLRKKYCCLISQHLFKGPAKLVSHFLI